MAAFVTLFALSEIYLYRLLCTDFEVFQIFQNFAGHLQTVGDRNVKWSKFCTEDAQFSREVWTTLVWCFLLCACELICILCKENMRYCSKNIQNLVVQVTRHLGFVPLCSHPYCCPWNFIFISHCCVHKTENSVTYQGIIHLQSIPWPWTQ
jgi:cytochrome c biogenesis factor